MKAADRFLDTNVLLYLLSGDDAKADCAEEAFTRHSLPAYRNLIAEITAPA